MNKPSGSADQIKNGMTAFFGVIIFTLIVLLVWLGNGMSDETAAMQASRTRSEGGNLRSGPPKVGDPEGKKDPIVYSSHPLDNDDYDYDQSWSGYGTGNYYSGSGSYGGTDDFLGDDDRRRD